jgi:alanyl-tRNA synthetase
MQDTPVYWSNPLEDTFVVTPQSVSQDGTQFHIQIDENVVRPAGGGQAGDRAVLEVGEERHMIINTVRDGEKILLVSQTRPKALEEATLVIDMEWRQAMMKNHTGEHLFVRAVADTVKNVEVGKIWIDGNHGSVEIMGDSITRETLLVAEERVNKIIEQSIDVKSRIAKAEELDESIRAREGVTEKHSKLRIVEVEDFDQSACSGIHVANTRDIKIFKIVNCSIAKDRAHVEFYTGSTAIFHLIEVYNMALTRKDEYPFQIEQLGAILDKSMEIREEQNLLIDRLMEILPGGPSAERIGEVKYQAEMLPGFDNSLMKQFVKASKMSGPTVLLLVSPGKRMHAMLRTNEMDNDASFYIQEAMEEHGGRGGGRGEVFTCGFSDVVNPRQLFEDLRLKVRSKIRK